MGGWSNGYKYSERKLEPRNFEGCPFLVTDTTQRQKKKMIDI